MAMIKVFDADGVKELKCFDTLLEVPYLAEDEEDMDLVETTDNPFA